MIAKRSPQTEREKQRAYEVATLRDVECVRCRRGTPLNRHHRQGRDDFNSVPSNLVLLCGSGTTGCHGYVHAHPREATEKGWIVPSWARSDRYPILLWRNTDYGVMQARWALLDDSGGVAWIGRSEAEARLSGEYPGVSIYDDRKAS